jgi:hypothetical protein
VRQETNQQKQNTKLYHNGGDTILGNDGLSALHVVTNRKTVLSKDTAAENLKSDPGNIF